MFNYTVMEEVSVIIPGQTKKKNYSVYDAARAL